VPTDAATMVWTMSQALDDFKSILKSWTKN